MNKDKKFIEHRLKLLKETAKELKSVFKKTKIPVLEDLYLEIKLYTSQIQGRLNHLKGGSWKNK